MMTSVSLHADVHSESTTRSWIIAAMIAVLALGLRWWGLHGDLNADEVWILSLMRGSWRDMFASVATDWVHPPLYYVILRGWCAIAGASAEAIRSWSAVCGVASVVMVFLLGRALGSERSGLLAAGLLAVSSMHIFYSQLVRPWGTVTLLTLLTWWATVVWLRTGARRWWWVSGVAVVTLTFSNYLGWMTVGILTLWVWRSGCRRRRLRTWCWWLVLAAVLAGCWLLAVAPIMLSKGTSGYLDWVTRPTIASTIKDLNLMHGRLLLPHATGIGGLFWLIPLGVGTVAAFRQRRAESSDGLWIWIIGGTIGSLAFLWVMGRCGVPIWNIRYLLPLMPLYCLAAAFGIERLSATHELLGAAAAVALIVWSIAAVEALRTHPTRIPFQAIAAAIEEEPLRVPVIVERTYLMNPILHYTRVRRERLAVVFPRNTLLKEAKVVTLDTLPSAERLVVVTYTKSFAEDVGRALGPSYRSSEEDSFSGVGQELEKKTVRMLVYQRMSRQAAAIP